MAYYDSSFDANRTTLRQRIARLFETPFDRRYRKRTARIDELRMLSDAELSRRGIAREDILFHVFSGKA
ncbi:hypothetical protein SAMN05216376_104151 [Mameliella alba]|uniref:hypothetical protein n=1 Tax=Mameliella alba TaxID=561184 RepID=UPI0008820536|nr:hypothetical protein [Mameliella alba]OWV47434.1 hypothetical protein CDZ96_13210 [Mameliella alba]PTR38293.1 hypothetical protein LX94_02918 [Mameliella alba]GGF58052.1 hypothetical protein GCM10011319_19170 [Mameliella alba]SDC80013.1 hypothetical protein SAMN05216376_104151 [Mameliella alba]